MTSFLALRASVCACRLCLTNSPGMLHRSPAGSPSLPRFLRRVPPREREAPSSKPGRPLYFLFTPERAQFCSRCLLRIRTHVFRPGGRCVGRSRHGIVLEDVGLRAWVLTIYRTEMLPIARSAAHNPSTSRIESEAALNPSLLTKEGSRTMRNRPYLSAGEPSFVEG